MNCSLDTAFAEMQETKRRWSKPGGVLGYHIIHSYAPGEVTPEQAHQIGVEFAAALLGSSYEAVISTHLDRAHLHCHIVFNSVSLQDGKKYRSNRKSYYKDVRRISNEISRRHGLSVIEPTGSGEAYAEWNAEAQGKATIRGIIRKDIDSAIAQAFTFQSFLAVLQKRGYTVKYGANVKHTAIRPQGGQRFIRLDSLGEGYTEAEIREKLKAVRSGKPPTLQEDKPRQFLPKRKYRYIRKPTQPFRHNPKSLRGLYFYYLHLLGKDSSRRLSPFPVRKEVMRLARYQAQFRLLREYRIDSTAELDTLHTAIQADLDALTSRRAQLYREKRHGLDVAEDIAAINGELRDWRKKLRLCVQIEEDAPRLRALATEAIQQSGPSRTTQRSQAAAKTNQSKSFAR